MRIGTTPTHTFTIPAYIADVSAKIRVVYRQGDKVILVKDNPNVNGNDVIVQLTQEETLRFSPKMRVEIQLRVLTEAGEALTSDIILQKPYECLENEVMA